MNPGPELDAPQSNPQHVAASATGDRSATTLVVCDVGRNCSGAIRQALHRNHDLAVLLREPQEPVGVFALRVAERVRRMPSPVVEAFVGLQHGGPGYASLVRRLARCLPSGATLTMYSEGSLDAREPPPPATAGGGRGCPALEPGRWDGKRALLATGRGPLRASAAPLTCDATPDHAVTRTSVENRAVRSPSLGPAYPAGGRHSAAMPSLRARPYG